MSKLAYVSVDTENDSASPLTGNMIEIAISARDAETGEELFHYASAVRRRADRPGDDVTLHWLRQQGLYKRLIEQSEKNPPPRDVMNVLCELLSQKAADGYEFEWVARPAAYDWMWLWTYWCEYGPTDDAKHALVPFKCTCLSTLFNLYATMQNLEGEAKKLEWRALAEDKPHTHLALDDAREQGTVHFNLMRRFKSTAVWEAATEERKKRAKKQSQE